MTKTKDHDPGDVERENDSRLWTVETTIVQGCHGDVLCLGPMTASFPAHCTGPSVQGLDWESVPHDEIAGAKQSRLVTVVGTYTPGTARPPTAEPMSETTALPSSWGTFTVTRPPVEVDESSMPRRTPDPHRFDSPCPPPPGGWADVDPTRTGSRNLEALNEAAPKLPGFAHMWVDQKPGRPTVHNVSVAHDPEGAEKELRRYWGGPLCVSKAARSRADLDRIWNEVQRTLPGVLGFEMTRGGTLSVDVIADDGARQSDLDRRYGRGTVTLNSALSPVASTPVTEAGR